MTLMERVDQYFTDAGVFYLATLDGEQPKCRPLGMHLLINDTVYFGGAIQKDMVKQMQAHPYAEFVATANGKFMRFYGQVEVEYNTPITDYILEQNPRLKEMYDNMGLTMGAFHLTHGTVEFRGMMSVEESFTF